MSASETPAVRQHQERLAAEGIDVVRVTYPDLIGTDRARDVLLDQLPTACEHGLAFCRAVYHTSPQGDVVPVAGGLDAGLPDIHVRPDLDTLLALPWEPGVATCLGESIDPATGAPAPESPRDLLRSVLARCAEQGLRPVVGPELEYFLCDADPASPTGWTRYSGATGAVYTAGLRADPENHLLRTLRHLRDLRIGVTNGNHEFDGGQFEINLTHSDALSAADRSFRFKAAVKELARKEGRLATFMARPFNDAGGSGFHLHLSCDDDQGRNAFDDPAGRHGLSDTARHAIAGVLAHAPALAALANPTVNSYKRFGPDTLAPWLIDWGLDNRSAMVRIPPERGAGARLELRLGDAGANPYLLIAGTIAAALLGVRAGEEPPAPLEGYGYDTARSAVLPMNLSASLDALEADTALTEILGKAFTTSYLSYKRDEVERFQRHVTDWEFTEYAYHL
ncbi:glutamine synthetase family protein [Streptomyces caniscabiei]|uniref:Glutamine synthetase family protein n=1 Tax=Streptomyces caniscabiei TaxID=2746961 RepID=A0ABU4N5C0_9ACTN|nr:glutamine synthetase family protein [Streptomyces caniscabiei]MBE4733964.1 glutamine synthetase [Streptomyces caniscabiei]MBE4761379.1 glutamine synthetase [Streptomyces caniscabiei]MBE4775106.1 glutamine synthetase [Streptomyces caniscabiei]MBE4782459.1 glutamine synthetase [Streptomyces caniscabiei]MBE4791762.1 glutamine synthetase [Streptomyces caniscabiei]